MGMLEDKVFVITGAGGGLGRAHARAMAAEGAKLVINDLGTSVAGEAGGDDPAGDLVDVLRQEGVDAVANRASVAEPDGAQSMVDDALEHFGRLDGVVNNAGILRDKTLVKMTDEMWRSVMEVHLDGTFYVTRAALRHFQSVAEDDGGTGEGRIINTTSIAGLRGNFGQANYGAAKAGIAGLTRVAALEAERFDATVNAIAPVAKTRMTDDIGGVPEELAPEKVSPLVVWLASDEAADVSGRILGAHGNHYFEYRMETTPGVERDEKWESAEIGGAFEQITQPASGAEERVDSDIVEQVDALLHALTDEVVDDSWTATLVFAVGEAGEWTLTLADGEATIEQGSTDEATATITFADAETLLAVAKGEQSAEKAFMSGGIESDNMQALMQFGDAFDLAAAADVLSSDTDSSGDAAERDEAGLNRALIGKTYRGSARFVRPEEIEAYADATANQNPVHRAGSDQAVSAGGPIAPPLFPVKPLHRVLEEVLTDDDLNADLLRLVHGEQDMQLHAPLKAWDLVAPRAEITAITDKSSGQLLRVHLWLMRAGEKVCDVDSVMFIRAPEPETSESSDGRDGAASPESAQGAQPDEIVHRGEVTVDDDQPMRYAEASGDHNPIHTDPDVAQAAGLPGVILHGLCTMAFACNEIVDSVCEGDPTRLARIKTRFSKPVLPGDTLETVVSDDVASNRASSADDRTRAYAFSTRDEAGDTVLSKGVAEVRATTN